MILTYRYRVKDATTGKHLRAMSEDCNRVWNRCVNEQKIVQRHYAEHGPNLRWPSHFDFCKHFVGRGKDFGLHSDTMSEISRTFTQSRNTHKRCPKRRGRKSLGWVPLIKRAIQIEGDTVTLKGQVYRLWLSRPIPEAIKSGSFSQDARGRWYFNVVCEVAEQQTCGTGEIALDLGLLDIATGSDGRKIPNPRWFRKQENALAIAQRAHHKARAKSIHAKIKNCRQHNLHQESLKLVREFESIVVGDVTPNAIAQTRMAKSSLDAGWAAFKNQLRYKAIRHGARFQETDESFSTVTCSTCRARSGPSGLKGLRIRRWVCCQCGIQHDRDQNAALNILAGAECRPLAEEIPVL